uniref:Protein FRA10AC1 n=1 Tax=Strigamia maritima TaxID=126957 RepID=T1JG60_STRMM
MSMTKRIDGEDYDSAFDDDAKRVSSSEKKADLLLKDVSQPTNQKLRPDYDSHWNERSKTLPLLALDAYSRHKELINNYYLYYSGSRSNFERNRINDKTDLDVLRENHQFVWSDEDKAQTWEQRLAKKYYDKLFKEYCIADLTRYKENKIGMRWRIEKEVVDGKGQFFCASKHCNEEVGLRSWEVNFSYAEQGQKKNALVKLRLCPKCTKKLNFHHKKKEFVPKRLSSKHAKHHKMGSSQPDKESESSATQNQTEVSEAMSKETEQEIWSNKPLVSTSEEVVSKEQEFEDFFEDLFL